MLDPYGYISLETTRGHREICTGQTLPCAPERMPLVGKKTVFVDFGLYGLRNKIPLSQQEEWKRRKHINTHINYEDI